MTDKQNTVNGFPVFEQWDVSDLDRRVWDVLVIGAGPAGSTAAYHLSRAGHRVLLTDMAYFPRDKICGDCMISDVDENLKRLGLQESMRKVGVELSGISVYSPSGIKFDIPGRFMTLRRPILDSMIAQRAIESGTMFIKGQVTGLEINDDHTVAAHFKGEPDLVQADIAVIATGAHIGLARKLGMPLPEKPSAIAMRCYVRSKQSLEELIMSYDRNLLPGYGWIVPLGDREFNVGCGLFLEGRRSMDLRGCFEKYISEFPPARRLMAESEMTAPLRSGALRCGLEGAPPLVGRSILMAGETIGTTFPLTGEGVGQAMTTAAIAADVVHKALIHGDRQLLREFSIRLDREVRPRHAGFKYAQKWVSIPALNNFMAKRVKRSAYLRDACADFITRSEDPRSVYSVSALLRSFVS